MAVYKTGLSVNGGDYVPGTRYTSGCTDTHAADLETDGEHALFSFYCDSTSTFPTTFTSHKHSVSLLLFGDSVSLCSSFNSNYSRGWP